MKLAAEPSQRAALGPQTLWELALWGGWGGDSGEDEPGRGCLTSRTQVQGSVKPISRAGTGREEPAAILHAPV